MRTVFFEKRFPSTLDAASEAISEALDALVERGWAEKGRTFALRLCLEEAIVNAVEHGNCGNPELEAAVTLGEEEGRCSICIEDQGCGFCVSDVAAPAREKACGRGICILKHYMESVEYDVERHCLTMVMKNARMPEGEPDMKEDLVMHFEQRGDIVVGTVRAASVLDAMNVARFGKEVAAYVQKKPGVKLLLNFEHVDYLSSAVLSELLTLKKLIEDENGQLRLCALSTDIQQVFQITNLDKVFVIYEDCPHGVKFYQRSLIIAADEESWSQLNRGV